MSALRWAGFALGLVVVLGTAVSLTGTLVVPRAGGTKLIRPLYRVVRAGFLAVAHRLPTYEAKDKVLAFQSPVTLISLLLVWLVLLLAGYTLLLWLLNADLGVAFRQAGSSLFTLGFAANQEQRAVVVEFVAAASGPLAVALLIGYLPSLYASYNRREALVTMLESRAGTPAWGPEILARHQLVHSVDALGDFYADWERWAADVSESHTSYRVLMFFRSPSPWRSWVVGITAVLDSAALLLALNPSTAPSSARLCLRMGFTALRDLVESMGYPVERDPKPDDPISLTYDDFSEALDWLRGVGFPMERSAEEAWAHFRGWRVNYEAVAYRLADRTVAAPAPWTGPRRHLPASVATPRRPPHRSPDGTLVEERRPPQAGAPLG